MFYVYIIFSTSIGKFYVGSTQHLQTRIDEHNHGKSSFTKKGMPWTLVFQKECDTRAEAVQLEMKIKKRGIERFLDDNKIPC